VLERRLTLDHWIASLSDRSHDGIDPETRTLLRMGLYQLAFLDRIPDHAAVNETVSLAGKRTRGFVNAILRAFLRANKAIELPDRTRDPIAYLSAAYSFAPAICAEFVEAFGIERAESLLSAFCQQPPLTLRVNTLRISREELLNRFRTAGIDATETPESTTGILLPSMPLAALPGFAEGDFFVQDEASQLCVEALDARPGMRVLDTCACPGSKTFGIAMEMHNEGTLIAGDLHASKLSLVESGARRLGLSILSVVERDARASSPEWTTPDTQFDRILCDVPCSGFGVLAKKPELRYKDPAESRALPDIQLDILCNSFSLLREGGKLVYSTCTILPEENEGNLERFLKRFPEAEVERRETFYPDTHGTDGFFVSVIRKREDNR
jgi:16S rRNA (cytosine967-C5)-methyltransferase